MRPREPGRSTRRCSSTLAVTRSRTSCSSRPGSASGELVDRAGLPELAHLGDPEPLLVPVPVGGLDLLPAAAGSPSAGVDRARSPARRGCRAARCRRRPRVCASTLSPRAQAGARDARRRAPARPAGTELLTPRRRWPSRAACGGAARGRRARRTSGCTRVACSTGLVRCSRDLRSAIRRIAVTSCSRKTCAATYAVRRLLGRQQRLDRQRGQRLVDSAGSRRRCRAAWPTQTSPPGALGRAAAGGDGVPDRAVGRVGEVVAVDVLGHPADGLGVLDDELERLALQREPRVAQVGQRRRGGPLGHRPGRGGAGGPRGGCAAAPAAGGSRRVAPRRGPPRRRRRPCRPARGRTPRPWTGRGSRRPAWRPRAARRPGRRPGRGRSAQTTLPSTKRYSGIRRATSSRTAASPCCSRRSHGSRPLGLDRDVGLADEVLVALERPQRGLLAGRVAVEGEDHLAAELVVVLQQPPQHPAVVLAERGAAGGDGGGDAGQVAGHHVGVALDDHGLRGPGDVAAGQVDAVEHLALLVDRGLGGVEVLRLDPVVVEDPAGAEADRRRRWSPGSATAAGRGTGRSARAGPAPTRPPVTSSASAKPFWRRCLSRSSPPRGANPTPNVSAASLSKPRLGQELPRLPRRRASASCSA